MSLTSELWAGGALAVLLLLCTLGGGSARADTLSLLYLRPAAFLFIAAIALLPGSWDIARVRAIALLLAGAVLLHLFQLIPLPPSLWLALPGHGQFAKAADVAGIAQSWRPLTLTPDATLNSLFSLVIPGAVLLGLARVSPEYRRMLVPAIVGLAVASAVLGVVQLSSGGGSAVFFYRISHEGSAIGFFANRNHQAALLALSLPALRVWSLMPAQKSDRYRRGRMLAAIGAAIFIVPMILVTGSRAGVLLALVGLAAASVMAPWRLGLAGRGGRTRLALTVLGLAVPLVLAICLIVFGRALSIDRIMGMESLESEQRISFLPLLIRIAGDFFPFGSGLGSFERIFQVYEPDSVLDPDYFNHAHDEFIEIVLTGGVLGLLLLGIFLVWYFRRMHAVFLPFRHRSDQTVLARLGGAMLLILGLSSLVDYPARTPLMAAIFMIACTWLAKPGPSESKGSSPDAALNKPVCA